MSKSTTEGFETDTSQFREAVYFSILLNRHCFFLAFNPLCANPTKWSNTTQTIHCSKSCLSMFGHFVGLALKGLNSQCYSIIIRSSRPNVICKKGVLKNFSKFTGKHLFWSLFFAGLRLSKKETLAQVFSCQFCEFYKNTFFYGIPPVVCCD